MPLFLLLLPWWFGVNGVIWRRRRRQWSANVWRAGGLDDLLDGGRQKRRERRKHEIRKMSVNESKWVYVVNYHRIWKVLPMDPLVSVFRKLRAA